MSRVLIYARTGEELVELSSFAVGRGIEPTQAAEGDLESVLKLLYKGDTLILATANSFDASAWFGYAVPIMRILEKDITVITRDENWVLKNDSNSKILVGFSGLAQIIQKETERV